MNTQSRAEQYIVEWKDCGYPDDIPDEVPDALMKRGLAPSYRVIAIALLRNDLHLSSLGFSRPQSEWYGALKREEIQERNKSIQGDLFS